jgi:hypothetical protein
VPNYINIPITVYGLEREGKSPVLGTWDSSSRDSPYTFVDKTHLEYRDRVTDESWRSHIADTIITDIKFESVTSDTRLRATSSPRGGTL